MKISKLEAARCQLDCAIRLYFNGDDMCSVITLSRAAFRILWDIYPTITTDGFEKPFSKIIELIGWPRFNEIANFLKHGEKDPEALMEPDEVHAKMGIGFSSILYGRTTNGARSPEMRAWETIMTLEQPEVWDSYPDLGHEGYQDFRRCVEKYEQATREQRLAMGKGFLQGFKRIDPGYQL
jgi:hypothetical protein